jgi:hypothetical protein
MACGRGTASYSAVTFDLRMRFQKLFLACMLSSAGAFAQDDSIYWLDNYNDALREAKRTQKPIFLEFRCEP